MTIMPVQGNPGAVVAIPAMQPKEEDKNSTFSSAEIFHNGTIRGIMYGYIEEEKECETFAAYVFPNLEQKDRSAKNKIGTEILTYNESMRASLVREFFIEPTGSFNSDMMRMILQVRNVPIDIHLSQYALSGTVFRERFAALQLVCPNIRSIHFSFRDEAEEVAHLEQIVALFAKTPHLQDLKIGRVKEVKPSQNILKSIASCTSLTSLDLSEFRASSDGEDILFLLLQLPELQRLNLSGIRTFYVSNELFSKCTKLTHINFSHSTLATLPLLPNSLKVLDLSHCASLCSYQRGLKSSQNITSIDLSYTYINDDLVEELLKMLPDLTYINITGCQKLSEQTVHKVEAYLNQQALQPSEETKELDLMHVPCRVEKIKELVRQSPNLEVLRIGTAYIGMEDSPKEIHQQWNELFFFIAKHCTKLRACYFGTTNFDMDFYHVLFSQNDTIQETSSDTGFSHPENLLQRYKKLRALNFQTATSIDFETEYLDFRSECRWILLRNPDVKTLHLQACLSEYNSKETVEALCQCKNLTSLQLSFVDEEELCDILQKLPQLEELDFYCSSPLQKKTLSALTGLTKLKSLHIRSTKISDADLEAIIAAYPELEKLSLSSCRNLTASALHKISLLRKLKALDLKGTKLADAQLKSIIASNLELEELNLDLCERLRDFSGLQALTKLRVVHLRKTKVSDAHLALFAASLQCLETLNVSQCPHIGQRGFELIGSSFPRLKNLDLSHTEIADLSVLAPVLPTLKKLNLFHCVDIPEDGFSLLEACAEIVELNLDATCFSEEKVSNLKDKLPRLEDFALNTGEDSSDSENEVD